MKSLKLLLNFASTSERTSLQIFIYWLRTSVLTPLRLDSLLHELLKIEELKACLTMHTTELDYIHFSKIIFQRLTPEFQAILPFLPEPESSKNILYNVINVTFREWNLKNAPVYTRYFQKLQ